MKPALLLQSTRANIIEREHYGYITVIDKNENVLSKIGEDNNNHFFLRSCAKPFQALPIIKSGTFDKFKFTLEELAVCCASHTGSKEHLDLIKGILKKIGLNENSLKCIGHEPSDIESKNKIIKENIETTAIYNNCSGKHAGMLAVCVNNKWDTEKYLEFNHPLQMEILNTANKYSNCNNNIDISIDNCSTPMYGMPFTKMGVGFLNLFLNPENEKLKNAFIKNPIAIGGKGNLDSTIIEISKGKLISKVGAEGLCIVINTQEEKALIVKIIDANTNARSLVTIDCLIQLGWLKNEDLKNNLIKNLNNKEVRSLDNQLVGEIKTMFNIREKHKNLTRIFN